MLQKALEALINFFCQFVIDHPRIMTSIIGILAALALIACVVAINLLIGGGNFE